MHYLRSSLHVARQYWLHRDLITALVRRDFKIRYLGSIFGSYWNFIHPVAMIAIYTLIFSHVMHARIGDSQGEENIFSFTVYLCAGLLPWNAFQEMVLRGSSVFFDHAHLLKKVSFPKEILQAIVVGSTSITFFINMGIYLILLKLVGFGWSDKLLYLPLIYFLQCVLATGLGMALAVLNVFFRDVQQFVSIIMQIWFWLTPIVYMLERVPEKFRAAVYFNPLAHLVALYHDIFFYQHAPSWQTLGILAVFAGLMFSFGAFMVTHFKDEVMDEL